MPTPALYYAVQHQADAGIQVTGSHNPPEYNGFKMLTARGPFYGRAIRGLYDRIAAKDLRRVPGASSSAVLDEYCGCHGPLQIGEPH